MNSHHELAMLSAQMWGEANAEGADPDGFGAAVADAYTSAYSSMEGAEEFREAMAYGVAVSPETASDLLRNIATKQAK